ncbi:mitochondrial inner membrane protease subunit 2 isoform X4 [Cavia porcellus]|uniref:mitochondrial inner membrane protease subunit 2 isoform X4 n=1 Tax=Cavia porcellus TaxID=10141 RepID=UPI002FE3D9D7
MTLREKKAFKMKRVPPPPFPEIKLMTVYLRGMAQSQGWVRRYFRAFCKGFFVAVPVAVTFLDRVACVARVEGASMQPSLNPGGSQTSDVVLLNHWKARNFQVQRGDIVSLVLLKLSVSGFSSPQKSENSKFYFIRVNRKLRDITYSKYFLTWYLIFSKQKILSIIICINCC